MKTVLTRSALAIALPFVLCWAFSATLYYEIKDAFWQACVEVRIEFASFRRLWKAIP